MTVKRSIDDYFTVAKRSKGGGDTGTCDRARNGEGNVLKSSTVSNVTRKSLDGNVGISSSSGSGNVVTEESECVIKETVKEKAEVKGDTIKQEIKDTCNVEKREEFQSQGQTSNTSNDEISFNKQQYIDSLSTEEKELLDLELTTMETSWLSIVQEEIRKPYFLELKRFLKREWAGNTPIFPPLADIYSWTRLTPLNQVKVLIIGQDPYHNHNQAHGLAFSVNDPTVRTPPSLVNIFKELKNEYPNDFERPNHSNLTKWAKEGVLMLNTCLTVKAHQANSHSKHGWEKFTSFVVNKLIQYNTDQSTGLVVMCWGKPAQKVCGNKAGEHGGVILYLCSAHPSPLSASRGFFNTGHFQKANAWLAQHGRGEIEWKL